jgi:hypothetical protein
MQHVGGCSDPLLCSCIAYAGLMGQILAREALLMVVVYIPAVCCSASFLQEFLKRDGSVTLLNSYLPPTYIVRVLST